MAVQIFSDLHLEVPKAYDIFEITPRAPYLALLGDIGNTVAHKDDYLAFLVRQLRQFRAVLLVPGNHEAYHSSWPETLNILRKFEQDVRSEPSLGEFVLLDRGGFLLPGTNVAILGCSLFSAVPPESEMAVGTGLNDFYQTVDWSTGTHNEAHRRDLDWINAQVAALEGYDIMIFTHWCPSRDARAVEPQYANSPIISAFSTDLSREECFRNDRVKLWAFGHTHYNCDFMVMRDMASPLRLVTNQKGYYFAPAGGYDANKTVPM